MGPRPTKSAPAPAKGPAKGISAARAAAPAPSTTGSPQRGTCATGTPRPVRPDGLPASPATKAAARPVVVERREIAADRPRLKPKPDAAAQLREVAGIMQDLPRDALIDRAELLILMRRLAGRILVVAETGLDLEPAHKARAPRQPFLARPRADARAIAEGVFGAGGRARGSDAATVTSRKGRTVRVEVRRARAAGQMEMRV